MGNRSSPHTIVRNGSKVEPCYLATSQLTPTFKNRTILFSADLLKPGYFLHLYIERSQFPTT